MNRSRSLFLTLPLLAALDLAGCGSPDDVVCPYKVGQLLNADPFSTPEAAVQGCAEEFQKLSEAYFAVADHKTCDFSLNLECKSGDGTISSYLCFDSISATAAGVTAPNDKQHNQVAAEVFAKIKAHYDAGDSCQLAPLSAIPK